MKPKNKNMKFNFSPSDVVTYQGAITTFSIAQILAEMCKDAEPNITKANSVEVAKYYSKNNN